MYLLAGASAAIECPAETVFDYVTDLTNFAAWFPGVVQVQACDALPPTCVGKQYEETARMPLGGLRPVFIRVVEVDPSRRFVTEGALALVMPRMEIEFHGRGVAACEVHWRMFSRSLSPLARWTILPLARLAMQRRAVAAMRRLKRVLESSSASTASGRDPPSRE